MIDYSNEDLRIKTETDVEQRVSWRSPSNLAIVKYWGKVPIQIPKNPSVSLTLRNSYTETSISAGPKKNLEKKLDIDFYFEGTSRPDFQERIEKYFNSLLHIYPFLAQLHLKIESKNSFPHSAGIASSASSMSALALCLVSLEEAYFQTDLTEQAFFQKASYLARLGSGSACRSVYPAWAIWGKEFSVEGSSDEFAIPYQEKVHESFQNFHDDILIVSDAEKSVSSTAGHALMETNIFAEQRFDSAKKNLNICLETLREGAIEKFGILAEQEALALHAMMMTSRPSYILMKPNSLAIIEKIRACREADKLPIYFSLDAGPNLHVLYPHSHREQIQDFIRDQLLSFTVNNEWIADGIGEGPLKI